MNRKALKRQLRIDEGLVTRVYVDTVGYLTVGIGHKLPATTPLGKGDRVSKGQIDEWFNEDVDIAIEACLDIYNNFETLPEEAQQVLANMAFNLGETGLSKFKVLRRCILSRNWVGAADAMLDSRWAVQVKTRADRLIGRMRYIPSGS